MDEDEIAIFFEEYNDPFLALSQFVVSLDGHRGMDIRALVDNFIETYEEDILIGDFDCDDWYEDEEEWDDEF